jgi:hypothetical protein
MRRVLAIGTLLATTILAQERRPLFGRVTGPDGAPLAGATVQLALVPLGREAQAAVEHPTATTDAQGRFRVDLRPWVSYRAWAIGPDRPDGSHLGSAVQSVWAGPVWELRATTPMPKPTFVVRQPAGPWLGNIRVLPDQIELPGWVHALDAAGSSPKLTLPHAPPATFLELLQDGQVLQTTHALPIGCQFPVEPVTELPMLVVDARGAPIADAEILQRSEFQNPRASSDTMALATPYRETWRSLGTTDAEGKLLAAIRARPLTGPADFFEHTNWYGVVFQARKAGFAATVLSPFTNRARDRSQPLESLHFELAAAAPLRGRLRHDADIDPAPSITVRAEIDVLEWWQASRTGSLLWHPRPADDGRFEVADLPVSTRRLQAWVDTGGGAPIVLHPWQSRDERDCTIDLTALRRIELRLSDANATPQPQAQVLLLSLLDDAPVDAWTTQLVPDSAGRVQMRLQPGPWLVFARDTEGAAHVRLDVTRDQVVDLVLQPFATMRGRLIDADGKPIHGYAVRQLDSSGRAETPDAIDLGRVVDVLQPLWLHQDRSDQDGNFRVRFLDRPGVSVRAYIEVGRRRTEPFLLAPNTDPLTVVAR